MREGLKEFEGQRKTFYGVFLRMGSQPGFKPDDPDIKLILIINIVVDIDCDTICDHFWFTYNKGFKKLELVPGDVIQFNARVDSDKYFGEMFGKRELLEKDYKLMNPNNISKVGQLTLNLPVADDMSADRIMH